MAARWSVSLNLEYAKKWMDDKKKSGRILPDSEHF